MTRRLARGRSKFGPSEESIGRSAAAELQRQGYETYHEVSVGYANDRADLVGVCGPVVVIVECKAHLSLRLLDQMMRWQNAANYIIAAYGGGRPSAVLLRWLKSEGFGLWACCGDEVGERVAPRLNRHVSGSIRKYLRPEQQTGEYGNAGMCGGGYFTPFRQTCESLNRIALRQPGIPLREALIEAKHHYSSSRSALSAIPTLIRRGVIKSVRVEGKPMRLYPVITEPVNRGRSGSGEPC